MTQGTKDMCTSVVLQILNVFITVDVGRVKDLLYVITF